MSEDTTRQVIGYVRVSSQRQVDEGNSPETQRQRIQAWADSKGWPIAAIYTDLAKSGKSMDNRPELARALRHACDTQGVFVAWKLDRWARSVADAGVIAERLRHAGAGLASITEAFDTTTSTGRLMYNILAAFAQFAREVTVERTQAGMDFLRSSGKCAGQVPFGYVRDGDDLIASEDEQAVIRQMQQWRAAGEGYRSIARLLNDAGTPTKSGGRWFPMTVKQIVERGELCAAK